MQQTIPTAGAGPDLDEFVYAVSHDLRGPLVNLLGFVRRLADACGRLEAAAETWQLTPEQRLQCNELLGRNLRPSLAAVERNAARMDRLVRDLLDLSRSGRQPCCPERIETGELLRAVVEEFAAEASGKGAIIEVGPAPVIWSDPSRIETVFRQLLNYALRSLAPKRAGRIALGATAAAGAVTCWVKDNGLGIEAGDLGRVFLPFARIRGNDEGDGVGLAIVHKLVRQLGGRVWVESDLGVGTSFYFSAPQAESDFRFLADKKVRSVEVL